MTYSIDLEYIKKLTAECERDIALNSGNLRHFFNEEAEDIYLLSLLSESYSVTSRLWMELNLIIREAEGLEEKDGKIDVPLGEKTMLFIQTALLAKVQVSGDLARISRVSSVEI